MGLEKCLVFMSIWGYEIPKGWPIIEILTKQKLMWNIWHVLRFLSGNYYSRGLKDHFLASYDPIRVAEKNNSSKVHV